MFDKLPTDILQKVHDSLPAPERVSLRMSLPKSICQNIIYDEKRDKEYGIILNLVKKGLIQDPSIPILKLVLGAQIIGEGFDEASKEVFLSYFPKIKEKLISDPYYYLGLSDKILYGVLDMKDLGEIDDGSMACIIDTINKAAKQTTPRIYDMLLNVPRISERLNNQHHYYSDLYFMMNYNNIPLLEHIASNYVEKWNLMCSEFVYMLMQANFMLNNNEYIKLILKYLPLDNEQKRELALRCIAIHANVKGYELFMKCL